MNRAGFDLFPSGARQACRGQRTAENKVGLIGNIRNDRTVRPGLRARREPVRICHERVPPALPLDEGRSMSR